MTQSTPPTPESELVARLRACTDHPVAEYTGEADSVPCELLIEAAATIERLDSELRPCRAALLAERMCADILQEAREHVALRLDGMERIGATAEAKRSARSLLQRMDAALAKEGTP